jgi:RHS repeat-associated protein
MLDDLGLVHMNGRIDDPLLGRFLSADVVVQFPGGLQSYNRYSYVRNNPLSVTDTSGFQEPTEEEKKVREAHMNNAQAAAGATSLGQQQILGGFSEQNTATVASDRVSNGAGETPAQKEVGNSSPTHGRTGGSKGEVNTTKSPSGEEKEDDPDKTGELRTLPGDAPQPGDGGPGGTVVVKTSSRGQNWAGRSLGMEQWVNWPFLGQKLGIAMRAVRSTGVAAANDDPDPFPTTPHENQST